MMNKFKAIQHVKKPRCFSYQEYLPGFHLEWLIVLDDHDHPIPPQRADLQELLNGILECDNKN